MGLQHVKNPIKLAREMLLRGERDLDGGNGEHRGAMAYDPEVEGKRFSSGAQGHSQLHKFSGEKLARLWGLEMVEPEYYFTQNRWDGRFCLTFVLGRWLILNRTYQRARKGRNWWSCNLG